MRPATRRASLENARAASPFADANEVKPRGTRASPHRRSARGPAGIPDLRVLPPLIQERRILALDYAHQRRPFALARHDLRIDGVELGSAVLDNVIGQSLDGGTGRHNLDLRAAALFEVVGEVKRFGDRAARSNDSVIAQHENPFVADIGGDTPEFVARWRQTLIVMVANLAVKAERRLGEWQEPAFKRRHRDAVWRMRVDDAGDILARRMERGVKRESDRIDGIGRIADDVAVEVELDETGCRHVLEEKTVGIDEQVVVRPRHARGDMGKDHVGHVEMRKQPVTRREIDARCPFLFADLAFERTYADDVTRIDYFAADTVHGASPLL